VRVIDKDCASSATRPCFLSAASPHRQRQTSPSYTRILQRAAYLLVITSSNHSSNTIEAGPSVKKELAEDTDYPNGPEGLLSSIPVEVPKGFGEEQ
jgi:hypothetical protein